MYHWILYSAGILVGIILFLRLPTLKSKMCRYDWRISVIIPARNEAGNIGNIIADLQDQSLKPIEIICVDDNSCDGTADLAARCGATVIFAGEKPHEWIGKAWANQIGAQAAKGDLLLFLDADVRLSQDAVAKIAAEREKTGGIVSIQPFHTVKKFYEHFSMFFNMIAVAATGMGTGLVKRASGMFGPVLLVPKALYHVVGGHQAVKSQILEDFHLGQLYAAQKIPVALRVGRNDFKFRMYAECFQDLWHGWTKNFYSGAINVPRPFLFMVIIWLAAQMSASFNLIIHATDFDNRSLFYAIFYVLFLIEILYAAKKIGNFRWLAAVFFPVFLAGFIIIFLASLIKWLFVRQVTWKGRKISTRVI